MVLTFFLAAFAASAFLLWVAYSGDSGLMRPSLLSPAILTTLLFLLGYIWRPLLYLIDPYQAVVFREYHDQFDPGMIALLMLAATVGIFSFNMGFRMRLGGRIAANLPELEWRNRWYVIAFLVTAGIIAVIVMRQFLAAANVPTLFAISVDVRRTAMANFKGNGPLLFFVTNLQTWFLMATMLFLALKGRVARGRKLVLILACMLFVLGLICYVALLSRAGIVSLIIMLPLIIHYYVRPVSMTVQLLLLSVLAAVIGLVGLFMVGVLASSVSLDFGALVGAILWRISGTLDQFEGLYLAVERTANFHFGSSFLQDAILTYVPRALWPGKPEVYGFVMLQNDLMPSLYQFAGLTATFPVGFLAEAYMNFGVAGFVIGPMFYGLLLRVFVEKGRDPRSGYALFLMPILASNIGTIRSLGGLFGGLIFGTVVILVVVRPVWRAAMRRAPQLAAS